MEDLVRNYSGQTLSAQDPAQRSGVSKQAVRSEKLAQRRALTPAFRAGSGARICKRLSDLLSPFSGFDTIVGYLPDGTEPDLTPLLREFLAAGKRLCLPRFRSAECYDLAVTESLDDCVKRVFGIPEPPQSAESIPPKRLQNAVWLVPGVAFDASCARLGRGKGIYDRLLAECGDTISIGIFYECQKCDPVPVSPDDRFLSAVVTEERVYLRAAFRFRDLSRSKENLP